MKPELRVFITDCEGPISKNDNAYELMSRFVPKGDRIFTLISRYDDFLADIVKKPSYKAGDTLRLILPFLKAYGATNQLLKKYSSQIILLVPGANETLKVLNNLMPSFIVSTSYEQYIYSLCEIIGFPKTNTYCTKLNLDKFTIPPDEVKKLKIFAEEISRMPMIEIPHGAYSINSLPEESRVTVQRLDEIFWKEIFNMKAGEMLKEVNPIGGLEKTNSVKDIAERTKVEISDVMYVGDSITDVEPFRFVRRAGGLTVSFNGNCYAVREAEIAVMSYHTRITTMLAAIFNRFGKQKVLDLVENWSLEALKSACKPLFFGKIERLIEEPLKIEKITIDNMERITSESSVFRKTLRGEAVAKLG